MHEPDSTDSALLSADEARRYMQRIQAEIAADADRRRREDPLLAREEREIERAWAHVAPPGAVGTREELLLDRVDRLSLIDVDAPLGTRPGVRQVKGAIRKGTYWYLRYMSDQLNALHNVQARLLRRIDDRVTRVERSVGLGSVLDDLLGPPSAPSHAIGHASVDALRSVSGPVVVMSCGVGAAVAALADAGVSANGIDPDAATIVEGVDAGVDLRVADPLEYLSDAAPGSWGGLLLGGFVDRLTVAEIIDVLGASRRALVDDGVLVVAVDDPGTRGDPERELLAGRGLSPAAWGAIADRQGWVVEFVHDLDDRVTTLLVARSA